MPHFLDINKTDPAQLRGMIDQAAAMKRARADRPKGALDDDQPLAGRMVALIFEKPSTRTLSASMSACAKWAGRPWS